MNARRGKKKVLLSGFSIDRGLTADKVSMPAIAKEVISPSAKDCLQTDSTFTAKKPSQSS